MKKILFILAGLSFNFFSLAQVHINDGDRDYAIYYKSGKIKVSGSHYGNTNIPDGVWTFYDENGKVTEQIEYKIFVRRFPNGAWKVHSFG
jgi:antitoxin component YwqK of YwqJK toxin-antitoxin module